jgi:electron transfer flavoprotein alpha subunit
VSAAPEPGAIAVVPVRDGIPARGGDEAAAEVGGPCLLAGSGVQEAAGALAGVATTVLAWEAGTYAPRRWAAALAPVLAPHPTVVLPGSPDGRDLAPLLALALQRPLVAWAHRVDVVRATATVTDHAGRTEHDVDLSGPCVVTLRPGSRSANPVSDDPPRVEDLDLDLDAGQHAGAGRDREGDATHVEDLPPDPTTMDLAEARWIVSGGAGLGGPEPFATLARLGAGIGASLGATRVATDAGWVEPRRQIGTTGVEVAPDLYLAFGISGAVQHVMGLGDPAHVIAVNVDPSCPMMAMADLAIVSDAPAVVEQLADLLAPPLPDAGAGR